MVKPKKTGVVPKLRFPEFVEAGEWAARSIGGLCRIRTGKKDANEGAADGTYPFFTCAESHIYSDSYSFDAEAILIAGNANVGQAKYYNGKFEAYQRTYVLTDFSEIHIPYLYAILSANLRPALLAQVQVSAMSYIRLPMLEEFQVATPPSINEQQKIADCLTSLDELIAAQGRKVEALKTYKRGLMQQLFLREGETVPRLRFPEFRDAPGWKRQFLDKLATRGTGHTPSKSVDGNYNGGIKWISLADSKSLDKGLIHQTATEISQQGIENSSAVLHPVGTVVLSRDAGVGKSAILAEPMAVSQHFIAWICHRDRLDNWFLYYVLQILKPVFESVATGSTIKTIGMPFFKDLTLLAPSVDEQKNISKLLLSLDERIRVEIAGVNQLKTHKQSLMQQLFPAVEVA